jgi:glycosyltransferase involved in cell wall biosynthesis
MAGVPVAMSDHAEKRMIVENYEVGVLFDETSPESIAKAVESLVLDDAQHAQAASNCLKAAQELNWEHEEFRYRTAMKSLLGDEIGTIPPVRLGTEAAVS